MPANKRIMSEYPVKVKTVRNKKKKEKMGGYGDGIKPRHQPYRRDHQNYLITDEDNLNYLLDDADVYDPPSEE